MKEHFTKQKGLKDKGFSMVEIVVIIAIMIVLLAILTPFLLKYVENSRIQKDDSAMDEVCHGILYALSDSEIFDEAVSYSIPNNYVTYTDSSGVYAAKYVDEEFWAPDGSGEAVTITFNPDENGTYTLANGLVNDMTYGNGSVAETRVADGVKQCYFSEMGQQKLYHKVAQTIGETFSEKSATYHNSSYTVFITFDVVNGIKRADVYGEWNGTNLSPDCHASLGSGTNSYTEDEEPEQTKTGGTTQSHFTSSDLQGSGGSSGEAPSYKQFLPCGHPLNSEGDHSELGCKHYACENCECVPALCGVPGHYEQDGLDHTKENRGYHSGHTWKCECPGWVIPEGGEFTMYSGINYNGETKKKVWTEGEMVPCGYSLHDYDKYTYGDYLYHISVGYSSDNGWVVTLNTNVVDKNQTSYGPILDVIWTRDVSVMNRTFKDCKNLTVAPEIPKYLKVMDAPFEYCSALQIAPSLKGCEELYSMSSAFYNCDSLTDVSNMQIPSTVTNMYLTFSYCDNLTVPPDMSHATSVRNMHGTFQNCPEMRTAPVLASNQLTNMYSTFSGCKKMTTAPTIPTSVTDMDWAFSNCDSLQIAPTIPSNVQDLSCTFWSCDSLTGSIVINTSTGTYPNCFSSVNFEKQGITLTGESTRLDDYGKTGSQYCVDCNGKCFGHPCGIEGHILTDGRDHYSDATCGKHKFACECSGWVVPEGGSYTIYKTGKVYNAGEQLPCGYVTQTYDKYSEGDYNYSVSYDNFQLCRYEWAVSVKDKTKTEYGPIRSSINGRDVMLMNDTFSGCSNLRVMPVIPDTITSMDSTFYNCTSLVDASSWVVSDTVIYMESCFSQCSSLTKAPDLSRATNLKIAKSIFHSCVSLTTNTPIVIPANVTEMDWAFSKCTSLNGTITIHANPSKYTGCFNGINYKNQTLNLTGASTLLDNIGKANASNYCATCNGTCQNNH